jgi:EAL domain-containing protein (putative c-di-GMP-specific phosphodiesterase class I)
MVMENPTETAKMLNAIKAMGAQTSVDDFGTGYSSLSALKRFPIDELKIDRSFVQNVPQDDDDGAIVSAIILMGHALGLSVIAEGVETADQLEFLRSQGCDSYQGYLRGRPVAAEDFERLLRAQA